MEVPGTPSNNMEVPGTFKNLPIIGSLLQERDIRCGTEDGTKEHIDLAKRPQAPSWVFVMILM